jgi:hypothetical protein
MERCLLKTHRSSILLPYEMMSTRWVPTKKVPVMSLPSQVAVINADQFTSEEVIQEAIKGLTKKRCLLDASIQVLEKRLRFLRCLSIPISPEEHTRLRSLKESSTHPMLPLRESTHSLVPAQSTDSYLPDDNLEAC